MADRPARKPSGLAEPETLSGEYRTRAFAAEHELREAQKKIAELEAERAQIEDRRRNVEVDILKGMTTNMRGIISAEVAAEVERAMATRPSRDFTLRIETPAPFQPVALAPGILPPPVAAPQHALPGLPPLVGAPMAPGLPPMRPAAPSSVSDQDIADAAASAKAERRLRLLAIVFVPIIGLVTTVILAVASHVPAPAPQYSTQPVYVQPNQSPQLPPLARPPTPLPH